MRKLRTDPRILRLARQLGLGTRGDAVENIRNYVLGKVRDFSEDGIRSLDGLRRLVAAWLSVDVEFIRSPEDIRRIGQEFGDYHPRLSSFLRLEFVEGKTEGLTLRHPRPNPGQRRYLAIIDARGEREYRAYFTIWHELAHLLTATPEQLSFEFRRAPTREQKDKDPLESLVDSIAGDLAFYAPIFRPVLEEAIRDAGNLTFGAIEAARSQATPDASFLAACMAAIRHSDVPVTLVSVTLGYNKAERHAAKRAGPDGRSSLIWPSLRLHHVVPGGVQPNPLALFKNMRVPKRSVLSQVFEDETDGLVAEAMEDQGWWETSGGGPRPPLPLRVMATRRGPHVYGLLFPLSGRPI